MLFRSIIRNAPNQNFDVIPLDYHEGYIQSWNLAVQRALPGKFTLDVAYVGNKGTRIPTVFNANAGNILGAGRDGRPLWAKFRRDTDTNLSFIGTSNNYNSMQVKFDRRFSGGFSMTTAYTWSKAIDISNDNGGFAYYINPKRSRATADFDRRHMFNQSYIWELPFGKGKSFLNHGGLVDQIWGTALLMMVIFAVGDQRNMNLPAALGPIVVGLTVLAIGMTMMRAM